MRKWHRFHALSQTFQIRTVSVYASSAEFYIIFSFLPSITLLGAILVTFQIEPQSLEQLIRPWLPQQFHAAVSSLIFSLYHASSLSILSLSAITLLWSASKGIGSLLDGMNTILNVNTHGYFKRRIRAVFCYLLFILGIYICLLIHASGSMLLRIVPFRFLFSSLTLSLIFTVLYRFFPNIRMRFPHCLTGGLLAGFGWIIFSHLFSIYVNLISNLQALYGRVGLIILMLLWVQCCLWIFLYGCVVAKLLDDRQIDLRAFIKRSKRK